MDWLTNYINQIGLNGSTAPNSSVLPLSTPVNTGGGNGNTSGSTLGTWLNTLSGLGTTAANAYGAIFNRPSASSTTQPAGTASTLSKYLPWMLIGGGVLLVVLLFRGRK